MTITHEEPRVYDQFHEFLGAMWSDFPEARYTDASKAIGSYVSCGVTVLMGVSFLHPENIVHKILKERHPKDAKTMREAFVVFSDIDRPDSAYGGNFLCKYIRENKLGDIIEAGPRMNPNTGNMIKIWIWSPPHESLATKNKFMPVHGKILKTDKYGNLNTYVDDPRFKNSFADSVKEL